MKKHNNKSRVLPLGIGLAVCASLFATPIMSARAIGFDGNAYLIWDCGESTPCYHLFSDIRTDNSYTIYSDTNVTADNHAGKTFSAVNVNTNATTFALKAAYDTYKAAHSTHTMQDVMDYEDGDHNRLALNPLEAPTEHNAYTHFGDRNFKVMIKSAGYVGASVQNATDGYEPDFGNALNSVVYRDIAGSTQANPTVLHTIPQQTEVILTAEDGAFDSVVAMNLENANAITIAPVSGGHKVTFNSAYYDRIIFKVTKGSTTGYVQIFRTAVQVQQTDVNPNSKAVNAIVYFDSAKGCANFDVYAKLVYKNGSAQRTIKLAPTTSHDDGLGNIEPGCLGAHGGGTGLNKGYYTAQADVNLIDLSGIYFTATNAGSTSTTYAGTVSGSKKGIYMNLENTPMENTKWGKITPERN